MNGLMGQLTQADEEAKRRAAQLQAMMRQGSAPIQEATPVFEAPAQQPQQSGIGQFLGNLYQNTLGDEEWRLRKAIALNSMRMDPSQALGASFAARLQDVKSAKQQKSQVNKTVEYLRKIGRPDLADLAASRPDLATDLLKQAYGIGSASAKSYAPQLDPKTGQYYVTTFDPATNQAKRIDVSGAVGETPEQEAMRTMEEKLTLSDYEKAVTAGQEMFSRATTLDTMLSRLGDAYQALERGGKSGIFQQYIPAFDESTAALQTAATSLGIDIINSATFGALSESELKLALKTGLPMSLGEEALKTYIKRKVAAQAKLRDELLKQARALTSGTMRYSEFTQKYQPKGGTEVFMGSGGANKPDYISDEVWQAMSQEDKDLFR